MNNETGSSRAALIKRNARRFLVYPVTLILALILISPTLPIDISILIISYVIAMIGLGSDPVSPVLTAHLDAWRSKVRAALRLDRA